MVWLVVILVILRLVAVWLLVEGMILWVIVPPMIVSPSLVEIVSLLIGNHLSLRMVVRAVMKRICHC